MNEEDGEDGRLGSILKECRISASQESYLKNCPFARESDVFLNDSEEDLSPWTSTHTPLDRIVMVSPPESPKDNEVFQTPPEGSIIDSSQEKEVTAAEAAAVAPVDSIPGQRIEEGDGYVVEEDDVYAEAAVDLARDSDNLGFTSLKLTQVSNNVSIDPGCKPLEIESSIIEENVNNQEEEEEVEEFSSPKTVRKTSGGLLGEGTSSDKMVTDDFERFKYLSSSVVSLKRKEVCPVASNGNAPVNRNEILKALLEALEVVTGKTNEEETEVVDLLETTKKRGIVFPRPRWWPPAEEGTDD